MEILRRNYPEIGLTGILVLLYVAENPGMSIAEVADVCGLTDATASRTVRALTPPNTTGALPPSLGLLEVRRNPEDTRERALFLSDAGREVCRAIDEVIGRADRIERRLEAAIVSKP